MRVRARMRARATKVRAWGGGEGPGQDVIESRAGLGRVGGDEHLGLA